MCLVMQAIACQLFLQLPHASTYLLTFPALHRLALQTALVGTGPLSRRIPGTEAWPYREAAVWRLGLQEEPQERPVITVLKKKVSWGSVRHPYAALMHPGQPERSCATSVRSHNTANQCMRNTGPASSCS